MTLSAKIISVILVLFQLTKNALFFTGVPLLALRLGRPISRIRLKRNMLIYVLAGIAVNLPGVIRSLNSLGIVHDRFGRFAVYLITAGGTLGPLVFGAFACAVMLHTKRVDEKMPAEFSRGRVVQAVVTALNDLTRVECDGREYIMSKEFPFRIGDRVRVRITDESNECYLV